MKTKLTKWGNSYAIRLPKHLVDDLQLTEASELMLHIKENSFAFTKPSKQERLTVLLESMKKQEELDWGAARGKEAW